jgi:hypothetical protein
MLCFSNHVYLSCWAAVDQHTSGALRPVMGANVLAVTHHYLVMVVHILR